MSCAPAATSLASTGYYDTRSSDFVSHDRDATYLAVALRPTDDKAAPGRRRAASMSSLSGEPGVTVGGGALAQEQVNKQIEPDLRTRRAARVPAAVPALAAVLPQPGRRAAAAARRRPRDRRHLPDPADRERARRRSRSSRSTSTTGLGLGLAIDYSLFIVSRYREELARRGVDSPGREAHGARALARQRRAARSLFSVAHRRRRARVADRLPAAVPVLDGDRRRRCVALLAAAIALVVLPACSALLGPRVNALAPRVPAARAPSATRRHAAEGFWYRLSPLRHAAPGPDRRRRARRS